VPNPGNPVNADERGFEGEGGLSLDPAVALLSLEGSCRSRSITTGSTFAVSCVFGGFTTGLPEKNGCKAAGGFMGTVLVGLTLFWASTFKTSVGFGAEGCFFLAIDEIDFVPFKI
jgi:hypothetical protein